MARNMWKICHNIHGPESPKVHQFRIGSFHTISGGVSLTTLEKESRNKGKPIKLGVFLHTNWINNENPAPLVRKQKFGS